MPPPAPRRPRRPPTARPAAQGSSSGSGSSVPPPSSTPLRASYGAADAPQAPGEASAQWQGRLYHRRGSSVAELCGVSIQVPGRYYDQLPSALYATDIPPRHAVPLGPHVVCRCSLLPSTSDRQLAALAAMAKARLVAVAPLQQCELVVVPYHDGKGRVRVVGFLRLLGV